MDHIGILHSSIEVAVRRFQRNPFDFLYERDLQSLLFGQLLLDFDSEAVSMTGGYHKPGDYGGDTTIRTVPVKCEYPILQKFDIAVIDSLTVRHFDQAAWDSEHLLNDAFWNQPVRAALEIKYCQLGGLFSAGMAGLHNDLKKLERYRALRESNNQSFLGIGLLFVMSATPLQPPLIQGELLADDPEEGIAQYIITPTSWARHSYVPNYALQPTVGRV